MPLAMPQLLECMDGSESIVRERVLNELDVSSATWGNPLARGLDAEAAWPTLRGPTLARRFVGATLPYAYWTFALRLDSSAWVANPDPDRFLVTLEDDWVEAPSWAEEDLNISLRYLTLCVAHHADNYRARLGIDRLISPGPRVRSPSLVRRWSRSLPLPG